MKIYIPSAAASPRERQALGDALHELLSNAEISTAIGSLASGGHVSLSPDGETLFRMVMLDLEMQRLVTEMPV